MEKMVVIIVVLICALVTGGVLLAFFLQPVEITEVTANRIRVEPINTSSLIEPVKMQDHFTPLFASPSEVISSMLEVGQEVKVKVINIDREKKRIGLSIRALLDDPWKSRLSKYSVGQLVEGVITRLTKFGAFARLEGDIEGLIHISEISESRIEHPKEVLKEGDVKSLRVIRIDPDQHRIGLSLRKVDSAAFADKDFKLMTAEFGTIEPDDADDEEQQPSSGEMPADTPDTEA